MDIRVGVTALSHVGEGHQRTCGRTWWRSCEATSNEKGRGEMERSYVEGDAMAMPKQSRRAWGRCVQASVREREDATIDGSKL